MISKRFDGRHVLGKASVAVIVALIAFTVAPAPSQMPPVGPQNATDCILDALRDGDADRYGSVAVVQACLSKFGQP